ncbi:hypothetical protein [Rhodoferax sp. GW822-FHT02A01]|uniref:hypothetical protein n=1 Tax=Rhodoferax sp. GW822-FHT02A01 TaxID=3141537 RepID=UPI00315DE2A6
MNLPPKDLLYGVAPRILIDCASQLHETGEDFSLEDFCKAIGAPSHEAMPVIDQLVKDGFMIAIGVDKSMFQPTKKMAQLALAKVTNGISRHQADQFLIEVLQKAHLINSDPDTYQFHVGCIVVFGSYLGDKDILGDLDLGVSLTSVAKKREEDNRWTLERIRESISREKRVMSHLRLRRPAFISLHGLSEVLSLETPYRVVFGTLPEVG